MKNFDRCVIILSTPQYRGSTRFGCEKAFTYRYPLLRFSLKPPDLCGWIQPEPLAPGVGDGDCSFRGVGVVCGAGDLYYKPNTGDADAAFRRRLPIYFIGWSVE